LQLYGFEVEENNPDILFYTVITINSLNYSVGL